MIPTIIKAMEAVVDIPIRPYGTDINEECICYTWTPQTDDGAVAVGRLELRIIARELAKAESLQRAVLPALLTVADNPKNGYLGCYLNGGGNLWDDDLKMTHHIYYLYITTKSEVSYNG